MENVGSANYSFKEGPSASLSPQGGVFENKKPALGGNHHHLEEMLFSSPPLTL